MHKRSYSAGSERGHGAMREEEISLSESNSEVSNRYTNCIIFKLQLLFKH